ncbi:unnamed protein product [Caenorhabditis nigoni]
MIILLLASLAIGYACGQDEAAIIAPIKPLPVKPVLPSLTCATVLCITNSTCVMYEALDGKMKPYCLPIDYKNTCAYTKCPIYQKCVMVEVTCVKAPCYPVPECRPRPIIRPPIKPYPVKPPLPVEAARKKRQTDVTCLTAKCATPGGCAMTRPLNCDTPNSDGSCPLQAGCVQENPCHTIDCSDGTQCVLHEVICVTAPCNPVPTCEPIGDSRCPGKNQEWLECGSACPKKCGEKEPEACIDVCREGCFCKKGFCLNKLGQCVANNNCGILSK